MKSFKDYLLESKKTYDFKIKFVGDLPAKFESTLKTLLQKYSVEKISSSKTPIQKVPLDFANVSDQEVHIFEVSLNYPVISPVLEQYIGEKTGISLSRIVVRTAYEPEEEYQKYSTKSDKKYKVKLETNIDEDEQVSTKEAQELVGEKRVLNLFKELSASRKESEIEGTQSTLKNIDIEEKLKDDNTKSPLGNKKLPEPKGIRK
jgi:hypothetical protein